VKVSDLSQAEIRSQLQHTGISLIIGPYILCIQSKFNDVAEGISLLYADYQLQTLDSFADFHISIESPIGLRSFLKPQVNFAFDGRVPFKPLPRDQAVPLLEWGTNWCIGNFSHQFMIIHAAVIEKNGFAAILPGQPGAGKSTLCAGLVSRGWRLLSDELTLISPEDKRVVPVPRPVSLKNESIDVIREFASDAVIGPVVHDTSKGTVAHMRSPAESVEQANIPAIPAWIVFPRYKQNAPAILNQRAKGRSFMELAEQSFNYNILGVDGFKLLNHTIDNCNCYNFTYGHLSEAIEAFDALPIPQC